MKIYEYVGLPVQYGAAYAVGSWHYEIAIKKALNSWPSDWRLIDPDPTIAHTIELESCNAVITKDSCYFRDAPAPVISLEEMQRVTRCMEMLNEADQTIREQAQDFVKKHFQTQEKTCDVCNAENCKYNKTCIQCGCQM